jgi:hypothetical protein
MGTHNGHLCEQKEHTALVELADENEWKTVPVDMNPGGIWDQ